MEYIVILGIVLALLGYIVYTIKTGAEIEKATLRESQKVAVDKVDALTQVSLKEEAALRQKEENELPAKSSLGRSGTLYFDRLRPQDPDDLN